MALSLLLQLAFEVLKYLVSGRKTQSAGPRLKHCCTTELWPFISQNDWLVFSSLFAECNILKLMK